MFNLIRTIWRQQQIVEDTVSQAEQHASSFNFLIIGVVFGLLGGLWGQVIDRYFSVYGFMYVLVLALLSCFFLIILFSWTIKKIDPLIKKGRQEQDKVKEMINDLETHLKE